MNEASEQIAGQLGSIYPDYNKLKTLVDLGYFLENYVVSGGVVTKDVAQNNFVNVTEIVVSLDNDVTRREAYSFRTGIANATYYLDYQAGDFKFGTAHPSGSYLPVAQVTTDANQNVLAITDMRGATGGFRLKPGYMFPEIDQLKIPKVVDLFCMSGQSNMQGQSEVPPLPFEMSKYEAYEYKLLSDSLTTVKHPVGEDIGDLIMAPANGWGSLVPRFAESYFNTTNNVPLIVSASKGATTVEQWLKAGSRPDRYAKLVEKVNKSVTRANQNGLTVRHKCFVWLQGESDGLESVTKQAYKTKFLTLWNDLKNDCGFTTCLIIRVAKFYTYNVVAIMKAQEELAREYDDIVMLTRITGTFTEGNGLMQSNWHYTNAGLDLAGSTAGRKAGEYLFINKTPVLEAEPYPEAVNAAKDKYEFNFRAGTIGEASGKITHTLIGTPVSGGTYIELDSRAGIKLGKDITLDGDATISFTGLFSLPYNVGGIITAYEGNVDSDFAFIYTIQQVINVTGPDMVAALFKETSTIIPVLNTYNHFVIQKAGRIYSLYFNNELIQTIFNGPQILNVNTLLYGDFDTGVKGRAKHCMINSGGITIPKEADPLFYSNNEKGTT